MEKEISCWNCEYCEYDTNCCVVPDASLCPFMKQILEHKED